MPEAGDGISIEGDTISVENPNRGIYTQEEFDRLSPEQQKSGTYFIADGYGDIEVASNIYSLKEIVVGRWIDGRPIYRKVIYGTTGKMSTWVKIGELENKETVISLRGITNDINGNLLPVPFSSQMYVAVGALDGNNENTVCINAGSANFVYCPAMIFVEYTKTTDNPTIEIPTLAQTLDLTNNPQPIEVTEE